MGKSSVVGNLPAMLYIVIQNGVPTRAISGRADVTIYGLYTLAVIPYPAGKLFLGNMFNVTVQDGFITDLDEQPYNDYDPMLPITTKRLSLEISWEGVTFFLGDKLKHRSGMIDYYLIDGGSYPLEGLDFNF